MSGDDWGDIFAAAVDGIHLQSPLGIADIELGTTAWSAKTVKSKNAAAIRVRLISGRNDVNYSFGNQDPFDNIQETGNQVLQIWNNRVEEATQQYPQLRTIVLIRDMDNFRFKLFEQPTIPFDPADYTWSLNPQDNFEGRSVQGNRHTFTWQPGGTQFTIIRQVGGSARSFEVRQPDGIIDPEQVLNNLGFDDSWVTFL